MTFIGHALPATCYTASICVLGLAYKRAKNLKQGESLAQYIPERDTRKLLAAGTFILLGGLIGCVGEFVGWGWRPDKFLVHWVVYLSYSVTGLVAVLEGKELLPPDSHRFMLAVASLLEGVIWTNHVEMKAGLHKAKHMFFVQLSNGRALAFLYGALNPGNVPAFVGGWMLYVATGMWMWVLAFDYLKPFLDEEWAIAPLFCIVNLILVVCVAVMTARVYKKDSADHKSQFSKVADKQHEEDEQLVRQLV